MVRSSIGQGFCIVAVAACALTMIQGNAIALTIGMVANNESDSVTVFDADTDTVIGTVALPAGLYGDCSVTCDQTLGFVTDFNDRVHVIDLTTTPPSLAAGTNPIPISNNGEDTAITPDQKFLIVCDGGATQPISVIDIANRVEIGTFSVNADCNSVDVCSDGSVLVTSAQQDQVRRLTVDSSGVLTNTGDVFNLDQLNNVTCSFDALSGLAVTRNTERVQSFTIPGLSTVDNRALSGFGISAVINRAGTLAYIRTNGGFVDVFGYDSTTAQLSVAPVFQIPIASTPTFFGMDQMAISQDGSKLYVSQPGSLEVFDATNGNPIASIVDPAFQEPTGVCLPAVADSDPPLVLCSVEADTLWPPNHDLIDVGLSVLAIDDTDPNPTIDVRVYSDEDDEEETGAGNHSPDATYDGLSLRLRSERKGNADGRVYLIVVSATNSCGATGTACCTVVVPHSQSKKAIAAVDDQADAAQAFCELTGDAPPDFFIVGDGAEIGPKQ